MGTLYVVGVPEGDPDDITFRALRALREAVLVVGENENLGLRLLTHYGLDTPFATTSDEDVLLVALESGDAAVLTSGWSPGLPASMTRLLQIAVEHGYPVVPVPGPDLSTAALVVSGLAADSFVHLGKLPEQPAVRHDLLALVLDERRTLVMLESADRLAATLADVHDVLGDRPLAMTATSDDALAAIWRGTVNEALAHGQEHLHRGDSILIVGGAREQIRWDEVRLRAEVRACLDQGLGAKEISQQLSARSGWSRREIYRLATEIAQVVHKP